MNNTIPKLTEVIRINGGLVQGLRERVSEHYGRVTCLLIGSINCSRPAPSTSDCSAIAKYPFLDGILCNPQPIRQLMLDMYQEIVPMDALLSIKQQGSIT